MRRRIGSFIPTISVLTIASTPWSALAQELADTPGIGPETLPRDLSPWGMYVNADPVVKAVLIGLAFASFVTIPAVVIYNVFARSIAGYRALLGDAAAQMQRLVSRDLDRSAAAGATARRPLPTAAE